MQFPFGMVLVRRGMEGGGGIVEGKEGSDGDIMDRGGGTHLPHPFLPRREARA